jgi:hypothetical protein
MKRHVTREGIQGFNRKEWIHGSAGRAQNFTFG